jgi:hypothetical protein
MNRKIMAYVVAVALGSAMGGAMCGGAVAQTVTSNSTTTNTGIAKPPPGTSAPLPKRLTHSNASVLGNNTPTLPQIALHPTATIGSPVPIAGPGGTTTSQTGD